jgi:uncharacterized damage-inducible protein DinB
MIVRPASTEYVPYYETYISKVPDGDVIEILEEQIADTFRLLGGLGEEEGNYRYEPEKWNVKQVLGHVIDTERVFSYRALAFARGDKTPLPPMEQDDYAANSNYTAQTLSGITDQLSAVRRASLTLFKSFDDEIALRTGTASGFEFSVRSIMYIIAGHEIHHKRVVKERYL